MPDPYSTINKQLRSISSGLEDVRGAISSLGGQADKTPNPARTPVDVDLLTSEEVGELRRLIEHEGDLAGYSAERAGSSPALEGMYQEFSRLGLTVAAMGVPCVSLTPSARWAVEKRAQLDRQRARATRDERLWTFALSLVSLLIGWLLGKLG